MKGSILLILTIATTFISCDDMINKATEQVDHSIEMSKSEMNSDVTNAKEIFIETYEKALLRTKDSSAISKIKTLYSSIIETSKFIDSLKIIVNKLDEKDLTNNDLIKKMFLNDGMADSVFNKVKLSYNIAEEVAIPESTKATMQKARYAYTEETKRQFFEMNNPVGVNIILHGIESELIKDGTNSLKSQ
jgi:hypothetical protein